MSILPEAIGLSSTQLQKAYCLLEEAVHTGFMPAAVLAIGRGGRFLEPRAFGRFGPAQDGRPLTPDGVFLVASITKPVTATAAMLFVEEGYLNLDQQVIDFIPEFGKRGKEQVRIWHLLTHTSGLPDMLPENVQLREAHAGLDRFIEGICDCGLLFSPGTNVSYQSCGIAILGEIVERLTKVRLREFMEERLFGPIGMNHTTLGIRDDLFPNLVDVALPDEQLVTDWHWNTPYWRNFGAPWGGMFSTAADLVCFLQMFLDRGKVGRRVILSTTTVEAMIRDQVTERTDIPLSARRRSSWGLGWELRGAPSGDLVSPLTFGHGGATGTMAWADPARQLICVLLTNQPRIWNQGYYLFPRLSNTIAAACIE